MEPILHDLMYVIEVAPDKLTVAELEALLAGSLDGQYWKLVAKVAIGRLKKLEVNQ